MSSAPAPIAPSPAALLRDTAEDCGVSFEAIAERFGVSFEAIAERFGLQVAAIVEACSDNALLMSPE